MQDRKVSGLRIKEYCKDVGIRESVYFYWQRKLREAACQELIATPIKQSAKPEELIVPNGWAVCESPGTTDSEKPLCIEIGDSRVLVNKDVDTELLTKVCHVLIAL